MTPTQEDGVVIVKIRRGDPEEEAIRSGTWKIAYADFVTAMMAFFLLMWLINATTDEQRAGISNYFNPMALATSTSGADGLVAGRVADVDGALTSAAGSGETAHPVSAPPSVSTIGAETEAPRGREGGLEIAPDEDRFRSPFEKPADHRSDRSAPAQASRPGQAAADLPVASSFRDPFSLAEPGADAATPQSAPTRRAAETGAESAASAAVAGDSAIDPNLLARASAAAQMQALKSRLLAELEETLLRKGLQENLRVEIDDEGLRIQITDDSDFAMFAVGSSRLAPDAEDLLFALSGVLFGLPNDIVITGHTDGRPYAGDGDYGNWELSADRANAARRSLIQGGISAARIARVEGYGDRRHLLTESPFDPRNRRISIQVLAAAEG